MMNIRIKVFTAVALGCWLTPVFVPGEEAIIINHGKAERIEIQGKIWKQGDGFLEQSGEGNILYSRYALGEGDAYIKATLCIKKIAKSAASFMLGENHFGFEGRSQKMFIEGPQFGKVSKNIGNPAVLENVPFHFEVKHHGELLTFLIDGKTVHEMKFQPKKLGVIGFRPHRATMQIYSCSVRGQLLTLPKEEIPEYMVDVFSKGDDKYHTYRIPAIITTQKGTLLAFCEGRKEGRSDAGNIDLVFKRSTDGGKTWSAMKVLWDDNKNTCGNPCPVVDKSNGRIWLPLTWNLGSDHESKIMAGTSKFPRKVFITYSDDDGKSWAPVKEISESVRKPHWRWYATGPGNAIQITSGKYKGRLVVPANHSDHSDKKHPYRTHVIYSDDHGASWHLGGVVGEKTNESTIVELSDGSILDNMRSYHGKNCRAISISKDGGMTWSKAKLDKSLIEPVCQGNILRYNFPSDKEPGRILFSNPASTSRNKLTVRVSYDEGNSWPLSKMIYKGSAAYSCMTVLKDRSIVVLFERDQYSKITFARFTLNWLTDGKDAWSK